MSSAVPRPRVSYAEYVERERTAAAKHEWLDGVSYAMAGGTPEHGILATRIAHLLWTLLGERGCVVTSSDVRIRVEATGLATYPDLAVLCGPLERAADDPLALTNPVLLVEVLSDATEGYDRGEKFAHYRRIPSLVDYLLVSQHEARLEVFHRAAHERWVLGEARTGERIELASLGAALAVDDVYRGVPLVAALRDART
jgi:Uma2 family endonuclease